MKIFVLFFPVNEAASFQMLDLIQLQGHVKRDPVSYKQEFLEQFNHFESMISLFEMNPGDNNENLSTLISFLSHVSSILN